VVDVPQSGGAAPRIAGVERHLEDSDSARSSG
jgi:hypothetical protein